MSVLKSVIIENIMLYGAALFQPFSSRFILYCKSLYFSRFYKTGKAFVQAIMHR